MTSESDAPRNRYCSDCGFYTDHVSTMHDGLADRGLLLPRPVESDATYCAPCGGRLGRLVPVPCGVAEHWGPDAIHLDAEPTHLSARVIDRDGDVWATHAGRWGCLTVASATQTWSDLWHVCGPLTLAPGWGVDILNPLNTAAKETP